MASLCLSRLYKITNYGCSSSRPPLFACVSVYSYGSNISIFYKATSSDLVMYQHACRHASHRKNKGCILVATVYIYISTFICNKQRLSCEFLPDFVYLRNRATVNKTMLTGASRSDDPDAPANNGLSHISYGVFDFEVDTSVVAIFKSLRDIIANEPSQGTTRAPIFCSNLMAMAGELSHNVQNGKHAEVVRVLPGSHNIHFAVHSQHLTGQYQLVYRFVHKFANVVVHESGSLAVKRKHVDAEQHCSSSHIVNKQRKNVAPS